MQIIVILSNQETRDYSLSSHKLHWSRARCSCLLRGHLGDGFSPFNGLFLSLSVDFCKLSSYSQIGRPAITRSVCTSYIGPVRGVRASYGAVHGLVWIFTLKRLIFKPNLHILQLLSYSQIERPATMRSVCTSYIGPVRSVRASYGVFRGMVWVLTP